MLQWIARPSFYMVMGAKLTPDETDKASLERVKGGSRLPLVIIR